MLSQKYQSVLNLGQQLNVQNGDVKEENGVLKISGTTETAYQRDLIWDEIKKVGGNRPTDIEVDIQVNNNDYYHLHKVVKGESFWALAEQYYKDGNKHPIISDANNKEHIHPDDELIIPSFQQYIGGEKLQVILTALGHDTKGIDGKVGNNTKAALKAFQAANGVAATGDLDDGTKNALRNSFRNLSGNLPGKPLQILLRDAGYSPGKIDGVPGKNTTKAIEQFQADYGLAVSGKADASTVTNLVQSYA